MTRASLASATACLYVPRLLGALLLALPVARAAFAFGPGSWPQGDALFFAPGGSFLLDALRLGGPAIQGALRAAGVVLVLLSVLGLVPLAVVLEMLARGERFKSAQLARGARWFPRFLWLSFMTLVAQGAVALAGVMAASVAVDWPRGDERLGALTAAVPVVLGSLGVLGLGILEDLARANLVARGDGAMGAAIRTALSTTMKHPVAVARRWLSPTLVAAASAALGAHLTTWIDVSRGGNLRTAMVLAVHQLTILVVCTMRIVWLQRAVAMSASPRAP